MDHWLWTLPSTFLAYTLAVILGTAYGFPRHARLLAGDGVLGVAALIAFIVLNAKAAALLIKDSGQKSRGG